MLFQKIKQYFIFVGTFILVIVSSGAPQHHPLIMLKSHCNRKSEIEGNVKQRVLSIGC